MSPKRSKPPRILYAGDTSLDTAAAYLAGLMTLWGWEYDYVRSDEPFGEREPDEYGLFIFSDYPAARIDAFAQQSVVARVREGAGLVMFGGWESYTGQGGDWDGTPIANALPVHLTGEDDRRNCDLPTLVTDMGVPHPITDGLPWADYPPLIGGFNNVGPKDSGTILLMAMIHRVRLGEGFPTVAEFEHETTEPLLVVDTLGKGRTVALLTDVAPHWVGPMVDWGPQRVTAEAPGSFAIEVGSHYARFFHQLLAWAANLG